LSESDQDMLVLQAIEAIKLAESGYGQNIIVLEGIDIVEPAITDTQLVSETSQPESINSIELSESQLTESENVTPLETSISAVEQVNDLQVDLSDEDEEPALELQFIENILEIAGNDKNPHKAIEFLLNVIDSYLEDAPHLVQLIDRAIAINDHVRLLQSLNKLRTSSDYIGALTLSYQCRQLESAVRANYVVLIYACLSRVAIEVQRATDALRIERSRYSQK
jgi:HPt (histidine-containing phosphotransfer) domain-containing protein